MQTVFGQKHLPPIPALVLSGITTKMVETYLVTTDSSTSLEAYKHLIVAEGGRNFTVEASWVPYYEEEIVIFRLRLKLVVLKGEGENPTVNIDNTSLWNSITEASGIHEFTIRVPYPSID